MALESLAALYYDPLSQPQAAIESMERLVDVQPGVARHLANRGVLYARVKDAEQALADASTALAIDGNPDTLVRVAGIYAQLAWVGEKRAARTIDCLRRAAFLNPSFVLAKLTIDDPDFDPLREQTAFIELTATLSAMRTNSESRKN